MRKFGWLLIVLLLAGCNYPGAATPLRTSLPPAESQLTPTPTTTPTGTQIPATPTTVPSQTPLPHTTVDASTMEHKLLMGYQGWFTCPGDGSNHRLFALVRNNDTPDAASFRVDMWPDASELTPDERCPTNMQYPNGQPAYLYSAYNPKTVMRHFQWMSQYGVDGVFVQRFGSELTVPSHFATRAMW